MENVSPLAEARMLRTTPEPGMPSSSPSGDRDDGRPKKLPNVTPRRFKRFFTPRSSQSSTPQVARSSRMPLGDISGSGGNRQPASSPIKQSRKLLDQEEDGMNFGSTPEKASPVKRVCLKAPHERSHRVPAFLSQEMPSLPPTYNEPAKAILPKAIKKSTVRLAFGSSSKRETWDAEYTSEIREAGCQEPEWQSESAYFYSRPCDQYITWSCEDDTLTRRAIPFSVAAAKLNNLVAVSDEEGFIRLLDCRWQPHEGGDVKPPFQKAILELGAHANAIIDLEFSEDDSRLVTASGDRTALVIDMHTHQEQFILFGHRSSVRQARFQPTSRGNIVATAGRDGMVNLWDLRCAPTAVPRAIGSRTRQTHPVALRKYAEWIHRFMPPILVPKDASRRGYSANNIEKSVTALSFLDSSMPHMLMTGSATSAGVCLWDMRRMRLRENSGEMAVVNCAFPDSANKSSRGIVSMAVSGDSSRLYTLCKDSVLYAYSTSQLRQNGSPVDALYGFKNSAFQVNSFYTGLSVRPSGCRLTENAREWGYEETSATELIAVAGGSQGPVVIPTDERHLSQYGGRVKPSGRKQNVNLYGHGTILKSGHNADLCGGAFTRDGSLVSVGDDSRCRIWFDDRLEYQGRKRLAKADPGSEFRKWCYAESVRKSDQAYYDMKEEW